MKTASSLLSERNSPMLVAKLRRVGCLFLLFVVLVLASVHWISQDIALTVDQASNEGLRRSAVMEKVNGAVTRLNLVILLAGLAMVPVFSMAAVLAGRFVRMHFKELEEVGRRKSQFVSMASHEMRTPLNSIKGFAEILSAGTYGPLNPEQAECVNSVCLGASNLKAIINDILDLAKIEAGTLDIKIGKFTLSQPLEEALRMGEPMAAEREVRIVLKGESTLDALGDSGRVRQVIANLMTNAIKFSSRGDLVEVSVCASEKEVTVSVSDSGPGMTVEEQAELFQEFSQGKSGKLHAEGAGLGLAISRKLVELQGGRRWVSSTPGKGSRFSFTLPAVVVEQRKAEPEKAPVLARAEAFSG